MTKTKLIGWAAMAVCVVGYAGGAGLLIAGKMDHLDMTAAVVAGGVTLVIGEIGLWVAAGCLGFAIFKKRKAIIDRMLGRRALAAPSETI